MKSWENFLKVEGWSSGYESVNRALKHYSRKVRSEKTRENFCSTLTLFCKHSSLGPDDLVALDPVEASDICQDFTDHLNEKGFSIRYLNVSQAYLKTFFRENGFIGQRETKVERYHQPARYHKRREYVPTPEEIHRMSYASGSNKNRAMILMLYTSGLRNSTLRALRYGDVRKELSAESARAVKIPVYPEMKKIDSAACKGDVPYYTFIDSETVKALKDYLSERKFGNDADEEPLFCSDSNQIPTEKQRNTPTSKNGLERMVKRAAKQAGIELWKDVTPKCLRKAFESALRNNRLDIKDQEFLMGHILEKSQDAYYDYSKTEDLRAKYAKITFFAATLQNKREMIKTALAMQGLTIRDVLDALEEDVYDRGEGSAGGTDRKLPLNEDYVCSLEDQEIGKYAFKALKRKLLGGKAKNGPEQKIISENELEQYLANGWRYVSSLNNGSGKCIISKQ